MHHFCRKFVPFSLLLCACDPEPTSPPGIAVGATQSGDDLVASAGVEPGGDLLLIVLDDVGTDKIGAYGEHPSPANTPTIDGLAEAGVLFRNAWVEPTCSPTRAALLTGRNPSQTGIGQWINPSEDDVWLKLDEVTVPELLREAGLGYYSAIAGKWHLITWVDQADPPGHPLASGFDAHAGSLGNPLMAWTDDGRSRSYYYWEKSADGEPAFTDVYMTTDTTDEALRFIQTAEDAGDPWFVTVSYNGPHDPLHSPPEGLLSTPLADDASDSERYAAMLEAVDSEIGRLLDDAPAGALDDATIVLIGDNGTPEHSILDPWNPNRGKHSIFEGGVRVPMIVTGPYVSAPGSETAALVQGTDLFATAGQIAGLSAQQIAAASPTADSVSFLPYLVDPDFGSLRESLFAERFEAGDYHNRALRTADWKYMRRETWQPYEELFRLPPSGYDEGEDLLAAGGLSADERDALNALRDLMDAQIAWNEQGAE